MLYEIEETLLLLDEVEGKNIDALAKDLNLVGKRIMGRVSDEVKGSPTFVQMHGVKIGTSVARFEPFSLVFGDGQILTALVENKRKKKDQKKPILTRAVKVSEWFLNRRRVTEYVYMEEDKTGQNRGVDDATAAKNIALLVMKTHERLNGKIIETPAQIKKRIKAIEIDVNKKSDSPFQSALNRISDAVKIGTYESLMKISDDIDFIEKNEVKHVLNNPTYQSVISGLEKLAS